MKCPICEIELAISDKQGIEIDYCPKCRGVWLDRGELEKLIERAAANELQYNRPTQSAPAPPVYTGQSVDRSDGRNQNDPYRGRDNRDRYEDDDDDYGKRRKKRGFLGEMFDIFD